MAQISGPGLGLGISVLVTDRGPRSVDSLHSSRSLLHLGVDNHTDGVAVLLHLGQLLLDLLLAEIIGPLGAGLGEGLLLGLRPVLVKPPLGLFANMFGPNSFEGSHSPGGLDVSNDTDTDDGRRLDDGDGLHDLFLVDFGAGSIHLPDDVGHTSLVAKEGSHVHWLGCIILGEGLALSLVALGTLLGQESFGSMTGCFKLSV